MKYNVYNHELSVGNIYVSSVSGSSLFVIGDSHVVELQSLFDTPPESYIVLGNNEVVQSDVQIGAQDG
ncbi:spore germination protein PD [Gracilibacillus halotolerans]|uniref:Spore germination protein PD n=1 Tax=Gracilibacillus halotolerans TaxID=74386 RepID=A0A841RL10_9BACI|nr:spore gernimation protein GerPD [Gracilibacillus halotolerans]MBB6512632.1 spore germination protein PD [Gracilibacillus halotolerans]